MSIFAALASAALALPIRPLESEPDPSAIVVTSSRLPENVNQTPETITVVSGDELRARHVVDLRGALELVMGVEAPPGGDGMRARPWRPLRSRPKIGPPFPPIQTCRHISWAARWVRDVPSAGCSMAPPTPQELLEMHLSTENPQHSDCRNEPDGCCAD